MDFRGGRMQGPPPLSSFRQRGGRGNSHGHLPQPHHQGIPGGTQRLFTPSMNHQGQWNPQNHMNLQPPAYNTQEEGLNYSQQPFPQDTGYKNYPFNLGSLSSPELINSTPPPQGFPYSTQQVFIPPPVFMDPACYAQPPIVTTPPMAQPVDSALAGRKFHFNSKDNVTHCSSCGHKNGLAETEIIKRDERIDALEKEIQVFKKQMESFIAENGALRKKMEAFQSQEKELKDFDPQKMSNVQVSNIKSVVDGEKTLSDDAKNQSQLSPDAAEFSPKPSTEAVPVVGLPLPATADVPVVSAKVMMDEDGDASTVVQESEAGTQVEENLFEKPSQVEMSEALADPGPEASVHPSEPINEDSSQVEHTNWSDEVDKDRAQEESCQDLQMEQVNTEVLQVAGESTVVKSSASEPNWREKNSPHNNSTNDHWQQKGHHDRRQNIRGGKYRGQPPGYGRGKKNMK